MRLDSALKNVVPNISRPKKSQHFLMKLPNNFQMREHSRPCRFHIINTWLTVKKISGANLENLVDGSKFLPVLFITRWDVCINRLQNSDINREYVNFNLIKEFWTLGDDLTIWFDLTGWLPFPNERQTMGDYSFYK